MILEYFDEKGCLYWYWYLSSMFYDIVLHICLFKKIFRIFWWMIIWWVHFFLFSFLFCIFVNIKDDFWNILMKDYPLGALPSAVHLINPWLHLRGNPKNLKTTKIIFPPTFSEEETFWKLDLPHLKIWNQRFSKTNALIPNTSARPQRRNDILKITVFSFLSTALLIFIVENSLRKSCETAPFPSNCIKPGT